MAVANYLILNEDWVRRPDSAGIKVAAVESGTIARRIIGPSTIRPHADPKSNRPLQSLPKSDPAAFLWVLTAYLVARLIRSSPWRPAIACRRSTVIEPQSKLAAL